MVLKNKKLVCGVGVNDLRYEMPSDSKVSYKKWYAMLQRCYDTKRLNKSPTYGVCIVCEEWLIFSNFKRWFDENYIGGLELDKDILIEGNSIYGPKTCCFVPHYLNTILTDRGRLRGDLPLGMTALLPNTQQRRINTTYLATCNDGYGKHITKTFKTVEGAKEWYSATKKRVVFEQVQRALNENLIGQRIADALLLREF